MTQNGIWQTASPQPWRMQSNTGSTQSFWLHMALCASPPSVDAAPAAPPAATGQMPRKQGTPPVPVAPPELPLLPPEPVLLPPELLLLPPEPLLLPPGLPEPPLPEAAPPYSSDIAPAAPGASVGTSSEAHAAVKTKHRKPAAERRTVRIFH